MPPQPPDRDGTHFKVVRNGRPVLSFFVARNPLGKRPFKRAIVVVAFAIALLINALLAVGVALEGSGVLGNEDRPSTTTTEPSIGAPSSTSRSPASDKADPQPQVGDAPSTKPPNSTTTSGTSAAPKTTGSSTVTSPPTTIDPTSTTVGPTSISETSTTFGTTTVPPTVPPTTSPL